MLLQITRELGQEILRRLAEYIDVDINIMDLHGTIVASTNIKRMNEFHSGALEVIRSGTELILDENNIDLYPSTKPGVNLPIKHHQKILGVVGVSGSIKDIIRITGLIRVAVEIVLEQVYIQRQIHYHDVKWNNWLHQLLHPGGYDEEELKEEATYTLHIETQLEWQVIVINSKQTSNDIDTLRMHAKQTALNPLFVLPFINNEIIITIPAAKKQLAPFLQTISHANITIGIGEIGFGLKGIRQSYYQAKQALSLNRGKNQITNSKDWKLERLALSVSTVDYDTICLPYEKKLCQLETTYLNTIDTYLDLNFSIKETAHCLHIHRNTLLYRLDQISIKTGLDPRIFHDAVLLKCIRSRNYYCTNAQ